jgi:hypothetical protein
MASKYKYIIGSGIAISPEKDMALFKKMSKQGWHMSGTRLSWYRFEKGEPTDYDYASNMELKVTPDMLALYEQSGWKPIVACDGFQIFRAAQGATPIFSDLESEIEALEEIKRNSIKSAFFWGLAAVCGFLILILMPLFFAAANLIWWIVAILFVLAWIPFAMQVTGAIGICKILRKKRKHATDG